MDNKTKIRNKILFLEREIARTKHLHGMGVISSRKALRQVSMYEEIINELLNDMPSYYKQFYTIKKEYNISRF